MREYLPIVAIILYFSVLLLLGLYKSNQKDKLDFFLGGRKLPYWMLGMSFVATWYGGSSAIISTNAAYEDGMSSWWILGGPTVIAALALIFLSKKVRQTNSFTVSEIVDARYSNIVGNMLAVLFVIYLSVWCASQIVILGQFIGPFLGTGYELTVFICVLVALIYTVLGGFSAVVLTEMIQFFLLVLGLFVTMVVAIYYSGGWSNITLVINAERDSDFLNLFSNLGSNLTYIISFSVAFVVDAAIWQRLSAARSEIESRKAAITAVVYFIPLYFMVVITGVAAVGVFSNLPSEDIVPALMNQKMGTVALTIAFLGIVSAVISTTCTTLNASSMYAMELFEKIKKSNLGPIQTVTISRVITVVVAIIATIIAIRIQNALQVLTLSMQVLAAGAFFPIIGAFFWKRATSIGAMSSIVLGGGFEIYNFFIQLGLDLPKFWSASSQAILIGLVISFIAFICGSLMSRPEFEAHAALNGTDK